jgi:hypothetical protein
MTRATSQQAAEAADRLARVLEDIDAGHVEATATERAYIAGAVYGIKLATGH